MNTKKILLIEDNPDDIELVKIALSSKNIVNTIDIVTDGEEALAYLFYTGKYVSRQPASNPILIFLDLQLPKISGFEVLKQLRNHEKTSMIPVIIYTSSSQENDSNRSYQLGANSFMRKPADGDNIVKVLKELNIQGLILDEPSGSYI